MENPGQMNKCKKKRRKYIISVRMDYRLFLKTKIMADREKMTLAAYVRKVLGETYTTDLSPEEEEQTFAFLEECAGTWED